MNGVKAEERPGQRFQNFVAVLERMFAVQDGVDVISPLRLRDKDTGRLREHDVVITRQTHHGPSLTAIECKDHGRRVGVPGIEAFAKKCEKTGIHRGVLVSASGFTATARLKANALNLTCMELAEAEAFDWLGKVNVISHVHHFTRIEIFVAIAPDDRILTPPTAAYDPDGAPYTGQDAQIFLKSVLPPTKADLEDGQITTGRVVAAADGFYVIDALDQRFAVRDITFTYDLKTDVKTQALSLHNYAGEAAAAEIASGQVTFSGGHATLALVRTPDGVRGYIHSVGASDHHLSVGDPTQRGEAPTD